ncbi:MAG: hypothetical protein RBT61_00805 [Candidatus Kapabacteria bacterium]|jgi:hypothetical protein|nr:hypothetical protein [Candidatus Kapabacteria bacterium]
MKNKKHTIFRSLAPLRHCEARSNLKGLGLLLLFLSFGVFAQEKKVITDIDSTKVTFGSQMTLTLKTTVDTLSKVTFPEGNFFGSLEVLESYPTDTLKENLKYHLIKKYGLTQWDSGSYLIPRLEVVINDKPYFSDSIRVEIAPVVVDTLKQQLYDIKEIMEAKNPFNYWIIALIILGLAIFATIVYFATKKRKEKEPKKKEIVISPIEKANTNLKNLEQKNLIEKGEVKTYYSELTDIARTYIEESIEVPAMESTTSELMTALRLAMIKRKLTLSEETLENLEKVLRQADLVKFAKSKPVTSEIVTDRERIEKTIFRIEESIPEEIPEEFDSEEIRQALLLKRKKKRQITLAVMLGSLVLFGGLVFLLATKGLDYIKDNFIGYQSKELYEGEWIVSDYGDPSVRVETPKVLVRSADNDHEKSDIISTQKFIYGSYIDKFSVVVSTSKFTSDQRPENLLERISEAVPAKFEADFSARNITYKTLSFNTKDGGEGMKTFGSMTIGEYNTRMDLNYDVISVVLQEGIIQITIIYDRSDEYGEKISERIQNSIELIKDK